MTKTPTWQRLALAGALLLSVAGMATAGSIAVPNGVISTGNTCGAGNPNGREFGGNCGSLVTVDNTTPAYVQDNSPAAEASYRVRFYVNLNGKSSAAPPTTAPSVALNMSTGDLFDVFVAYDGADPVPPNTAGSAVMRVELGYNGTDYTAQAFALTNTVAEVSTSVKTFKKNRGGWARIEVEWTKAAGTGKLNLWVNGSAATGLSNITNDTRSINYVRWGAVNGIDAGTTGTFKLDDFVSQRENYIGPAVPFADVPTTNGFFTAVQSIHADEIIPGCGSGNFCPTTFITRKEMTKFVLTAKEGTQYAPPACASAPFTDVPASDPYCPWIKELFTRGIVTGCGGGNFCPNNSVDRAQMVVFVQATNNPTAPPACAVAPFTDVPASDPFCRWIKQAADTGLTGGCGGGNFCPTFFTDRAQMSVFVIQGFGLPISTTGP